MDAMSLTSDEGSSIPMILVKGTIGKRDDSSYMTKRLVFVCFVLFSMNAIAGPLNSIVVGDDYTHTCVPHVSDTPTSNKV